jgi:3-hydroxyacyl-CoA dehydrogenase-like protein
MSVRLIPRRGLATGSRAALQWGVSEASQVAVWGASDAAWRLAALGALAGCSVRLYDADPAALDAALQRMRDAVEADLAAGRLTAGDKQRTLDGVLATTDLDEAVTHADVVVVAAAEAPAQRAALLRLGDAVRASAVVATTAPADALVDWLPNPGRLVRLDLGALAVEGGRETSAGALEIARDLARRVRREGVLATRPSRG